MFLSTHEHSNKDRVTARKTHFTYRTQPLKDSVKPIHSDQLGQTSGYDGVVMTYKTADLFKNTETLLAQ